MAHENKVMQSVNMDGEHICVDIFMRPDGTFGFEEYRRDPEDPGGWFVIGHHGTQRYPTHADALHAARQAVAWL